MLPLRLVQGQSDEPLVPRQAFPGKGRSLHLAAPQPHRITLDREFCLHHVSAEVSQVGRGPRRCHHRRNVKDAQTLERAETHSRRGQSPWIQSEIVRHVNSSIVLTSGGNCSCQLVATWYAVATWNNSASRQRPADRAALTGSPDIE